RAAAIGLAVYPAFVLRQGEAIQLWQHYLLIPLIPVSAFHAGMALTRLRDRNQEYRSRELALGVVQCGLLAIILFTAGGSLLAWVVALGVGTLLPLACALVGPAQTFMLRPILILTGMLAMRYWIISPHA
ncbi:MAG: hypothetical protein ACPGVU_26660, partial [Limisphaerales bacterium]